MKINLNIWEGENLAGFYHMQKLKTHSASTVLTYVSTKVALNLHDYAISYPKHKMETKHATFFFVLCQWVGQCGEH